MRLLPPKLLARARHGLLLAGALLFAARANTDSTAAVSEYDVKAALVYRTAKFIEWPGSAFAAAGSPFVTCVVGNAAMLRTFESLDGKVLGKHRVVVRRVTGDMLDLRQCHVAFFPSEAGADVDYALGKLQDAPVLTVGETDEFARRGGILALVTREQRVTFAVNLAASKRAGLTVSSQLLQLATLVEQAP